jgi:hypothetical protein
MRAVETIPGMEGEGIKENDGGGEFKYDIFDICKNFCKCHNVPLTSSRKKFVKNFLKVYDNVL